MELSLPWEVWTLGFNSSENRRVSLFIYLSLLPLGLDYQSGVFFYYYYFLSSGLEWYGKTADGRKKPSFFLLFTVFAFVGAWGRGLTDVLHVRTLLFSSLIFLFPFLFFS